MAITRSLVWASSVRLVVIHIKGTGSDGLGAQVRQDDVTIEVAVVDVLGRSVETGSTSQHTLGSLGLTFFQVYTLSVATSVSKGMTVNSAISASLLTPKEREEHAIIHRAGLVDGDSNLGLTTDALARVNLREPLVEATRSRTLVSAL